MPWPSAQSAVLRAFAIEAEGLENQMRSLDDAALDLPTRCAPWTVAHLFAHVSAAAHRVIGMLAEPAPPGAPVSAAGYYRPDQRFSPDANADRITAAVEAADHNRGALADRFADAWRAAYAAVADATPDRVVRTRHGDAMAVHDFMITRMVELSIHGIDLADALGRRPWLTPAAASIVTDLILPLPARPAIESLGWHGLDLLRKLTGRSEISATERAEMDLRGVTWLSLG